MYQLPCLEPNIKVEPPTYVNMSFHSLTYKLPRLEKQEILQTKFVFHNQQDNNEQITEKPKTEKPQKTTISNIHADIWLESQKIHKKNSSKKKEQPTFMIHVMKKSGNSTTEEVTFHHDNKVAKKKWSKITLV